jgi:hypothetical protein
VEVPPDSAAEVQGPRQGAAIRADQDEVRQVLVCRVAAGPGDSRLAAVVQAVAVALRFQLAAAAVAAINAIPDP